jgi:hypothetical protein
VDVGLIISDAYSNIAIYAPYRPQAGAPEMGLLFSTRSLSMTEEIWKPVVGFEHSHEVSNLGNLRTIQRHVQVEHSVYGHVFRRWLPQRRVTPRRDKNGYSIANLAIAKEKTETVKVHRVVAQAFIPNPYNLPQVNHKNGVKGDNRVENLEWCTNIQNRHHAVSTGLHATGEQASRSHLKERDVQEIRYLRKCGLDGVTIGKMYGVSHKIVSSIHTRRSWKYVADLCS